MTKNIIGDIHRILAIIILVKFLHMPELGKGGQLRAAGLARTLRVEKPPGVGGENGSGSYMSMVSWMGTWRLVDRAWKAKTSTG